MQHSIKSLLRPQLNLPFSHSQYYSLLGVNTTRHAFSAFLALIADPDYADVVRKMQEQINTNIGRETPRLADRQKLPYVEAVSHLSLCPF